MMINNCLRYSLTLSVVLSATGCFPLAHYQSLPESKQNYVGVWATQKDLLTTETPNNYILLAIGSNKGTLYINQETGSCTYSPLTRPIINNRTIEIPFFLTFDRTFSIDRKPYQKQDNWQMVLDQKTFYQIKAQSKNFNQIERQLDFECADDSSNTDRPKRKRR